MLPSARRIAGAYRRVPATRSLTSTITRPLGTTTPTYKWTGSTPADHIANEADTPEVQHDAAREGKKEHAQGMTENQQSGEQPGEGGSAGGGSSAATERAGGSNRRAKEEFPEAPDTIGMQDERGGKGS